MLRTPHPALSALLSHRFGPAWNRIQQVLSVLRPWTQSRSSALIRGFILFCLGGLFPLAGLAGDPVNLDLFEQGTGGYAGYRIPSVIVTTQGSVLAFCEGRRNGLGDAGDIDLLMRRSTDNGQTFSATQVIWDDGENTCGNPCPVVDQASGTIFLFLTHNLGTDSEHALVRGTSQKKRTVWLSRSTDDGVTWSKPEELPHLREPDWSWYATGPGAGIQMRCGRLVIPCDHRIGPKTEEMWSHVIYSDDHGQTWKLGGSAGPYCNECEVVELADQSLLLNMRYYNPTGSHRAVSRSTDGGLHWTDPRPDEALIEPTCQASIRRYSWPQGMQKSRILFSNPASQKKREDLTIRLSYDEGATWPVSRLLQPGGSMYSSLCVLPDGDILCFYENTSHGAQLTLSRFDLAWLTNGQDQPAPAAVAPGCSPCPPRQQRSRLRAPSSRRGSVPPRGGLRFIK
jgi:sialidase-1